MSNDGDRLDGPAPEPGSETEGLTDPAALEPWVRLGDPRASLTLVNAGPVRRVLRHQSAWILGSMAVGAALAALGMWATNPALAVSLSIAGGLVTLDLKRWHAVPLVTGLVVLGGLAAQAVWLPAALGASAVAGAFATRWIHEGADRIDVAQGALAAALATGIGLMLAPASASPVVGGILVAGLVGLGSAQGLWPATIRAERPHLPTARQIRRRLRPAYRTAAYKAVGMYEAAAPRTDDPETRRGLAEVAYWVFLLQECVQILDDDVGSIDVDEVDRRLHRLATEPNPDPFTRERHDATAEHLRRMLGHRSSLSTERDRTDALVGYALAYLEEARLTVALARALPGEAAPDRLPEVLQRLRVDAAAGQARRTATREMGARLT